MVGKNAAKSKLADIWRYPNVFNVPLLEPYRRSKCYLRPEDNKHLSNVQTEMYDNNSGEYEVESIFTTSKDDVKQVSYFFKLSEYLTDEDIWKP